MCSRRLCGSFSQDLYGVGVVVGVGSGPDMLTTCFGRGGARSFENVFFVVSVFFSCVDLSRTGAAHALRGSVG